VELASRPPLPRVVHVAHEELVHLGGVVPLHRRRNPLPASASPPPVPRFSFPRRGDGSLCPGGESVSFLSVRGGGDLVSVGGVVDLVGTWECRGGSKSGAGTVGFRSGLGLLPLAEPLCGLRLCVCGCGDRRGCLGQRPAEMGARDPGFHAIFASDWWEWVGSGSQTAVAGEERTRANGIVCGWAARGWRLGPNETGPAGKL
jgi:hypothetical protein